MLLSHSQRWVFKLRWREAVTHHFKHDTVDFTACPNPCGSGGQARATGLGGFPHQARTGMFGEGHTVCRSASCCWHFRGRTNGFSSGGQVMSNISPSYEINRAELICCLLIIQGSIPQGWRSQRRRLCPAAAAALRKHSRRIFCCTTRYANPEHLYLYAAMFCIEVLN